MADYPLTPAELAVQQQSIDRQRKIADLLQQQSFDQPQGQLISGHYVAPSIFQNLSRLAQGLIGKDQQSNLDKKQTALVSQQGDILRNQFGIGGGQSAQPQQLPAAAPTDAGQAALAQGASAGDAGPTNSNAARMAQMLMSGAPQGTMAPAPSQTQAMATALTGGQPVQSQQRGSRVIPGLDPLNAFRLYNEDPKSYNAAYLKSYEPTDASKLAMAAGADPRQANQDALRKATYIAPIAVRPGAPVYDPISGKAVFSTADGKGAQTKYDENGNASVIQVPGAAEAITAYEAAKIAGENKGKIAPEGVQERNVDGTIKKVRSIADTLNPPANAGFPAGTKVPAIASNLDSDRLNILQRERDEIQARPDADPRKAADLKAINSEIGNVARTQAPTAQPASVGVKFGQEKAAELAQGELSKKFSALNEQNQQAQTTNSYLDQIAGLAKKAGAGPFSDKQAYVNGLLSTAGISEKATNELSAKQLLDKYSSQIVTRLGQGGLGTDAARSILQAGYPNSKMTPQAIDEAVNNLKGANALTNAKTSLLLPHANERNPQTYAEKEAAFDQFANPQVFQYAQANPQQRAAIKQQLIQNGGAQDFARRLRELEKLGVKF